MIRFFFTNLICMTTRINCMIKLILKKVTKPKLLPPYRAAKSIPFIPPSARKQINSHMRTWGMSCRHDRSRSLPSSSSSQSTSQPARLESACDMVQRSTWTSRLFQQEVAKCVGSRRRRETTYSVQSQLLHQIALAVRGRWTTSLVTTLRARRAGRKLLVDWMLGTWLPRREAPNNNLVQPAR